MRISPYASIFGCLALFAAAGIGSAASLNSIDRNFLIVVARTDMTVAHEGQMAENQALRAELKDFAKTLVRERTESYEHVSELAAKAGISIPKGIDAAKYPAIRQLTRLKGEQFDREFARDEMVAERQALAVFKREAAHGHDPDVKAYASKTIPVLEKDLQATRLVPR